VSVSEGRFESSVPGGTSFPASLHSTALGSPALNSPALNSPGLNSTEWGMLTFLLSEVAFFSTLIVTYLAYMGKDQTGPTPAVLSLPLVIGTTICLLSSSGTVHLAELALRRGSRGMFAWMWSLTILLGAIFLLGTFYEWHELIERHHLTIGTNLFGTTYYTLVGFHALHLTVGLVVLSIVLIVVLRREVKPSHPLAVELTSWYWHFVDTVWVVVFTIVYVVSR
jgi:cytochrome c oxidase subunit III